MPVLNSVADEHQRGRVVLLNGGSSSGKTTIARKLQAELDGSWLLLGVDLFLWTLPSRLVGDPQGLVVEGGIIIRGDEFMRLHVAFQRAIATLAANGLDILIDDVLLDGVRDQRLWTDALTDVDVCWVGVRCGADIATQREAERGDRLLGAARAQADSVHEGVRYDFEVDTGLLDTEHAVEVVADHLRARWRSLGESRSNGPYEYPPISAWTAEGSVRPPPWEKRPTPEGE
jgi:chloramphenicol 3-O phosphotransferase